MNDVENCNKLLPSTIESEDNSKIFKETDGYYKCNFCPFRSTFRAELTKHNKKHTSRRKYVCAMCSFSSEQKSAVKEHMETKHKSNDSATRKQTYKCSQCSYQTFEKSQIISHEKSHFDEKFNVEALQPDVIINTNDNEEIKSDKLHYCSNCDFSAPYRASLIVHCTFNCPGGS